MIIKEVELENFQCYYGRKIFKFEKGMNIILGANAHGKSKLFDGINWLLNGEDHNREQLISEKAKANNLDFVVAVRFTKFSDHLRCLKLVTNFRLLKRFVRA